MRVNIFSGGQDGKKGPKADFCQLVFLAGTGRLFDFSSRAK